MTELDQVLAAFADGERVDADALDCALADAAARAYFIDLLALRGLVTAGGSTPARAASDRARPRPAKALVPTRGAAVGVAAALVACLGAGFVVGWRVTQQAGTADTVAAPGPVPVELPAVDIQAPAPTHVIRFQPGVDWLESTGGN